MYSYGPPHMGKQKQDDQLEYTYSSYVRILDVALKTSQKRWMIGRSGKRGSGISVQAARLDDDDVIKAFFRCLSNPGTFTELRTTSFIESTGVACSDSVSHNWVQVLGYSCIVTRLQVYIFNFNVYCFEFSILRLSFLSSSTSISSFFFLPLNFFHIYTKLAKGQKLMFLTTHH